jgi:uncharacterized protein YjbI with pentapeptide repeats
MTTMPRRDGTRIRMVAAALGLALIVAAALGIFWFGWDWKALIGWRALVDYIDPKNATGRKDAVQVYAVIVAGGIAAITAAVGLYNLRLTRRNLEQQRELEAQRANEQRNLEAQRAQGTALQAYYEQIGNLLTDHDLRNTQRGEVGELARGQTLTVLQALDASRKRNLLVFLHGAGLIGAENPAVWLTGADLRGFDLSDANLGDANLGGADLSNANLEHANLQEANLQGTDLYGAGLQGASLQGADLRRTDLTQAQLNVTNGDETTELPPGLKPPAHWKVKTDERIERG